MLLRRSSPAVLPALSAPKRLEIVVPTTQHGQVSAPYVFIVCIVYEKTSLPTNRLDRIKTEIWSENCTQLRLEPEARPLVSSGVGSGYVHTLQGGP